MRPPKKSDLDHFFNPVALDGDITDLRAKFKKWKNTDHRGKASVWTVLGKAYELGSAIANDNQARIVLVTKVSEDPDVKKSNKWDASRKHPFDLLLVLLLGLKEETKATKSQWLRTLEAAKKTKLSPSQEAFAVWIKKSGGIAGVLKTGKKHARVQQTIAQLAEQLPGQYDDYNGLPSMTAKATLKCHDDDFLEGFALVLVREADEQGKVFPVATVVNEAQIRLAMKSAIAHIAKEEKENSRVIMQELREIGQADKLVIKKLRAAALKEFKGRGKPSAVRGTNQPFREMFDEYLSEHNEMVPDSYKRRYPEKFN